MRAALLSSLALGMLAPPPAGAHAPRIAHCRYNKSLVPSNSGPVRHLRIRQAARRVDRYMPRCGVATFVAASANGSRRITIKGARWYVGRFTCHYRYVSPKPDLTVIHTRCVHHGRYASTVWFDSHA